MIATLLCSTITAASVYVEPPAFYNESRAEEEQQVVVVADDEGDNLYVNIDHTDRVLAHSTDTYTQKLYANETAYIYVTGDGDTDLDLYLYDSNGNLIDSDTDGTDTCLCEVTPRWTGTFKIKIKNLGNVYNRYRLRIVQ